MTIHLDPQRNSLPPLVSVIVPNYNHAPYLRERLESIYNQTYKNIEVILLDDASTDNSVEILREYAGRPNTQLVINSTNSGSPFAQWNRGVAMASGLYVWIAESDDCCEPTLLETLVRRLEARPGAVLAYCDTIRVDESGQFIDRNSVRWLGPLDPERWKHDHEGAGRLECATYLIRRCLMYNASSVLFRRQTYLAVGGADARMRIAGDWLMWAKLLLAGDYSYCCEPLNRNRVHHRTARQAAVGNSGWFGEEYRVVDHILRSVPVDPAIRRLALNELSGHYLWAAERDWGPNWMARQFNVYRVARRCDRRSGGRLLRLIFRRASDRFRALRDQMLQGWGARRDENGERA